MVFQKAALFLALSIFTFAAFGLRAMANRTRDKDSSMPGLRIKTQATIILLTLAMWLAFILFD